MSAEASISERLAEVSRLMRSPLAQSFGDTSEAGREGLFKLKRLMHELPAIEATTLVDALALVSIMGEVYMALVQHRQNKEVAEEAIPFIACALIKLRTCLADLAGMDKTTFGLQPEIGPQPLH